MTDGERAAPDPREARDPAGFVELLQALKDGAGLTYRELSARAEALGEVLPRSTVANMLARNSLPREELLSAYVRACGVGPGELERWLAVRKDLAGRCRADGSAAETRDRPAGPGDGPADAPAAARAGAETLRRAEGPPPGTDRPRGPAGDDGPDQAGPRDGGPGDGPGAASGRGERLRTWAARGFVPLVGLLALATAATTVVAFLRGPGGDRPREEAAPPAPGPVLLRALHSGLCLNERPGQQSGQVYQVPCAEATVPRYSLVRLGGGRWRIRSDHPDFGAGCAGIPVDLAEQHGAPLVDQECGKRGSREEFRIEAFDGAGREAGHRIRSAHSDLCLRVRDASREPWADVVQEACREDGKGQLFGFDPPRAP
ncbi:transcriptional regulator [Streptomyces sp. NRRL S-118]|uniref:transcriptional regulator n=1 Tax=Streptomyces sp. NRRL S-118 TaxID=1463881 RepID=UPI0004CBB446|nr:transcriptional regulator [Streptomyces sp. NRRL S-118]